MKETMDEHFMELALAEARKGTGWVNPNPLVGAVIVKNGEVIGTGYHEKFGGLHAERNALKNCKQDPQGATIYVTLEPCCHYGKTPPCTEALLESGISCVVIGSLDPNPLVSGKGVQILREHGVEVKIGVLEEKCREMNRVFLHYITTKTPFVVMKYAMTMDGKISTVTGKSRWITGEEARIHVHKDRHRYMAIMVGSGTVLADDPMLNCRLADEAGKLRYRDPIRIICDSRFQIPVASRIVQSADQIRTILAVAKEKELEKGRSTEEIKSLKTKKKQCEEAGCEILEISLVNGHISLAELMQELGKRQIDSILLEGGATLNWAALHSGIVNRVQTYITPKIFGGEGAKTPVGGAGVSLVQDAVYLKNQTVRMIGSDLLVESEVRGCSQES